MNFANLVGHYDTICRRYADVIMNLPDDESEKVYCEIRDIAEALCKDGAWHFISNKFLLKSLKQAFFDDILQKNGASIFTVNFFSTLVSNNRVDKLLSIVSLLENMITYKGAERVVLLSSCELDDDESDIIKKSLSKMLNKDVRLSVKVDRELMIGGVFLWRSFMLDMSLKGSLLRLRHEVMNYE